MSLAMAAALLTAVWALALLAALAAASENVYITSSYGQLVTSSTLR